MNISFSDNILSIIILILFGICLVIQLFYHWCYFSKVAFYKRNARPKLDEELEPVSVVLCARDAYEYLTELIPALLNQDYPDFEIVVVNDCSDDETAASQLLQWQEVPALDGYQVGAKRPYYPY